MSEVNPQTTMKRGRPPKLSIADQHELRRYREAGTSISRLAKMWNISPTTVHQILSALRQKLGPEQLPTSQRHLARWHIFRSANNESTSS